MSRTYCHTHSAYDCQTCADEILSLGIQVDKDRIKWLESEVARLEACAARTVPEGWRFDRCSDGSINVIKYGHGGANVEQSAEQARRIPEEVLWMLVNDMLSATQEPKK